MDIHNVYHEGLGKLLSRVRLFSTPWTAAYQAPPSMGFSTQEYWSGGPVAFSGVGAQSCPTLCDPVDCGLGEGNGNPLQYSCLENPMDGGAWQAAVHEVAKSRTRPSNFTFFLSFFLIGTLVLLGVPEKPCLH